MRGQRGSGVQDDHSAFESDLLNIALLYSAALVIPLNKTAGNPFTNTGQGQPTTNQPPILMKKFTLITSACVAALALSGPLTASAAPEKEASPSPSASPADSTAAASPETKAPRAIQFRGSVASVDTSAQTFTVAGKSTSRVFKVTDKTTVTKSGRGGDVRGHRGE